MEKEYSRKILVDSVTVICLLYLMFNDLSVKSGEINYDSVVKSICSVQKFQIQLYNIQSFRMTSNDVHRMQTLFILIIKNFIANSVDLYTLIGRLVKRE